MITDLPHLVRHYADAHADRDGVAATPLQGVGAMRAYAPTELVKSIYKPLVCLILQGAKQVTVGPDTHEFAAGQSAVVSADVPAVGRITRASRAEPYLALAVELDVATLLDLAGQVRCTGGGGAATPAVLVDDTDAAVADCALRLVRLLERPDAIPVLRPSILRELHYCCWPGGTGRRSAASPGRTGWRTGSRGRSPCCGANSTARCGSSTWPGIVTSTGCGRH